MPKTRVFVDTNVILQAFKSGTWTAICQTYAVETVEKCIEEALTGDANAPGYIQVDPQVLIDGLAGRHLVDNRQIVSFFFSHPQCQGLDAGELHLLAWLHAQGKIANAHVLVSTADKAALVAACNIGLADLLESLESLAKKSGVTKGQIDGLENHYRTTWLGDIKLKIAMGVIP